MKSLINIENPSVIVVKLLEMIEKSVGWILTPRGSNKDFKDGLEVYKEGIKNDQSLTMTQKAVMISTAHKDLRQYINQERIIALTIDNLASTANLENLDADWLAFFFEYAKNISREEVQLFWAKLLANKINGEDNISKKLIHVLSIIENEDIDVFCKICSMTFDSAERERSKYPFIYIKTHPSYYSSQNVRRYHLRSLADLGIINYDIGDEFVLPANVPLLKYNNLKIKLSSSKRINTGNIVLTPIGKVLYTMTERDYDVDFIMFCKKAWQEKDIQYKIIE